MVRNQSNSRIAGINHAIRSTQESFRKYNPVVKQKTLRCVRQQPLRNPVSGPAHKRTRQRVDEYFAAQWLPSKSHADFEVVERNVRWKWLQTV